MENLNLKNNSFKIVEVLEKILKKGQDMGLNLKNASITLDSIKDVIKNKNIKIALVGRFSDGKTSIIAGLLGSKLDNMKIGIDETSDELLEYKLQGTGDGVEIVDTPGLFGTKEKEVDGENIRLSEKTERYLSQAHIIVYVCDATTPIKNTHEKVIFDVLRKYNKLGVTIFVLNKMDNVCELEDEEDYEYNSATKKQWLIDGLKRAINLTDEEAKQIHAICISADPGRLGLDYWLNNVDYGKISRIDLLRKAINNLLNNANEEELKTANLISSSKDMISQISDISESEINPHENELAKVEETHITIKGDLDSVTIALSAKRQSLRDTLESERMHYFSVVEDATVETFDEVMFKYFGSKDENGNFGVLSSRIDAIFDNIIGSSKELEIDCANNVNLLNQESGFFSDMMSKYGSKIGDIKLDNNMVKAARDVVAPNVKFKPWGAVKAANNLNKGIAGVGLLIEAWSAWKDYKAEKELSAVKVQLKNYLCDYFNALNSFIKDDDKYYKLYPGFIALGKVLRQKEEELNNCKNELARLRSYQEKVHAMLESNIVDAEFEEISNN